MKTLSIRAKKKLQLTDNVNNAECTCGHQYSRMTAPYIVSRHTWFMYAVYVLVFFFI